MSRAAAPVGRPLPSQCSSRFWMPCATASENRIFRAISAPRWQRVSTSSLGAVPAVWNAAISARMRSASPAFNPVCARTKRSACGRLPSINLASRLKLQVVGHVELADARRVAAAAEVLQQQRVIELPYFGFAQTDLAADMDADPATADAVPGRLALDHIQCVAERAEQFGQDDLLICSRVRRGAHRGVIRKARYVTATSSRRRNTTPANRPVSPSHAA